MIGSLSLNSSSHSLSSLRKIDLNNSFVNELSNLFRAYAEGSELEYVALKASITLVQKPHQKSKLKDHISCLTCHMMLWKDEDFSELSKALQQRLKNQRLCPLWTSFWRQESQPPSYSVNMEKEESYTLMW